MFAQVQEYYHIRGEEGEPDHHPTHRQSRHQAEGGKEGALGEGGQDLGQHKPRHHEYHIQNEVKGHPFALEGDVIEVAQQQHGPADDGQGQQPGGQTVQTTAMGEIQPGQQQGDEENFQMFPQALPHRRDQSGDGAGQPGEEKMKPYPQDQGGNQGKNRLFLKNFHSSHLVSYYKLCPQWGKL